MSTLWCDVVGRRDKLQLVSDVLRICESPAKLTRIMGSGAVQWTVINESLDNLVDGGLLERIEVDEGKAKYVFKTTRLGSAFARTVDAWYERIGITKARRKRPKTALENR